MEKNICICKLPVQTEVCPDIMEYIKNVAREFAGVCQRVAPSIPDYVVVYSGTWSDLVFNNQDFFDSYINEAIKDAGLEFVTQGLVGGSNEAINERIRKKFPKADYVHGFHNFYIGQWRPCLYSISQ